VNFDPDRFPPVIRQALHYRNHLKTQYESECKRRGIAARQFLQPEATWMPENGILNGSTALLEEEGFN